MQPQTATDFLSLSEFRQIQFLDEFTPDIYSQGEDNAKLSALLTGIIDQSKSSYVKRTCFNILCKLSLLGLVNNKFIALSQLHNFLKSSDNDLKLAALKYIPFFPEAIEGEGLGVVKELTDDASGDVSSEAYLTLGLNRLSHSFSIDVASTMTELDQASLFFSSSIASIENRVDAEFFLAITNFCKSIFRNDTERARSSIEALENQLLMMNLYDFQQKGMELDIVLFKACSNLYELLKQTKTSDQWIDIKADIEVVYHVSLSIWTARSDQSLSSSSAYWSKWISQLEELVYANNLRHERRRLKKLSESIRDNPLEQFVLKILKSIPNDEAAVGNNPLLAFLAEHFGSDHALASFDALKNKTVSPEVLQAISGLISSEVNGSLALRTGSVIGEEVFEQIMIDVAILLPGYSENRKHSFELVFEEVIRYARQSFVGNTKNRFKFLFSKEDGGKGDEALEQDLQDDMLLFFEHSKISGGLEHEKAKFVDGGRVDILFKTDLITIPIELKKSKECLTIAEIESNYIAQAQTYAAGYDQLGLFVLMDLSDKSAIPPPNFKDWFRIHHLPTSSHTGVKHPDLVISVVIPGNRTLPSSKSTYD